MYVILFGCVCFHRCTYVNVSSFLVTRVALLPCHLGFAPTDQRRLTCFLFGSLWPARFYSTSRVVLLSPTPTGIKAAGNGKIRYIIFVYFISYMVYYKQCCLFVNKKKGRFLQKSSKKISSGYIMFNSNYLYHFIFNKDI